MAVLTSRDVVDGAVDWRGRPCRPRHHGGMRAAAFALGMVALEMAAVAAVGSNLITYVFGEMHLPLAEAANVVTNFAGAVFLLALLGGFLADSYLGCLPTILLFSLLELAGFLLLSLQASLPRLRPPPREKAGGVEAAVFFAALYMVAIGSGCLKPNMIAHGADQLAVAGGGGGGGGGAGMGMSGYFSAAYLCFCGGEVVALTAVVWVQTREGMGVGFGVSAGAMAGAIACVAAGAPLYRNTPPRGSIFTPIARASLVFVASFTKRKLICPLSSSANLANTESDAGDGRRPACGDSGFRHANKFRFLDKACMTAPSQCGGDGGGATPESPWELCTAAEVRQAKTLLAVAPVFACTIVFNTVLAQLQTFSVQQAAAMDTSIPLPFTTGGAKFRVPPASLQAIPYALMLLLVPASDLLLATATRRRRPALALAPLRRVGVGLFAVGFSMAAAAAVERMRRREKAVVSVMWLAPQYVVFGVSEMFTAVGLVEFMYSQAAAEEGGARAFMTALAYCSYAMGFFLSSALVSLVNRATAGRGGGGEKGWLGDDDLDRDRLDLFYWALAALSGVNFCCFLLCARWYNSGAQPGRASDDDDDDAEGSVMEINA
uniref:Major facilitator superfamily (MFS) profile domain-containing protein n=1 Tax=Leersia perrieri TaxID=77586 RepID=A0A0D9VH37_9ORYZ